MTQSREIALMDLSAQVAALAARLALLEAWQDEVNGETAAAVPSDPETDTGANEEAG